MESGSIATIVIGLSALVGVPLALRSRRKGGRKKVDDLFHHLQAIGVKASLLPEFAEGQHTGRKYSLGQKSMGIIQLAGRNIDSIDVIGQVHQYGVNYYLDFLVPRAGMIGEEQHKKTKLHRKKSPSPGGKRIDIEWKGDDSLQRRLNADYSLKYKLIETMPKGSIEIFPDQKHECARIRISYTLPAPEFVEALDMIAMHVKS